jgi:hypothetical protein
MTLEYLKKLSQLSVSSLAGFLVSGSSVSLMIALLNDMAQDGPSFLPWLIALFLITPVMGVLIFLEVGALLYEWVTGNYLGWELLGAGVLTGLGGGPFLHQVLIIPSQNELDLVQLLIFLVLGGLAGLAVFGTHWLFSWGWDILDPPVQGEKLGGISDD